MKTQLLCLLALISLCGTPGMSQNLSPLPPTYNPDTNPLLAQQQAVSGLDASRIPTKVLLNRTVYMTNPYRFAGRGDTTTNYAGFMQQYWEFYNAYATNARLLTVAQLKESMAQSLQSGVVPLLMLRYNYSEISATAFRD